MSVYEAVFVDGLQLAAGSTGEIEDRVGYYDSRGVAKDACEKHRAKHNADWLAPLVWVKIRRGHEQSHDPRYLEDDAGYWVSTITVRTK